MSKTRKKNPGQDNQPGEEQLYQRYLELDTVPKLVVQLLAVNLYRCGSRKVFSCLEGCEANGQTFGKVQPREMAAITGPLARDNLISKKPQGLCCDPGLRPHVVLDLLAEKRYQELAGCMRRADPVKEQYGQIYYRHHEQCLRELQFLCYTDADIASIIKLLHSMGQYFQPENPDLTIYEEVIPAELAQAYNKHLSPGIRLFLYTQILENDLQIFDSTKQFYYQLLLEVIAENRDQVLPLELAIHLFLLRGDITNLADVIARNTWSSETFRLAGQGWVDFLQNDNDEALAACDRALVLYKKEYRKRKASLPGYFGFFHVLTLIRKGDQKSLQKALEHIKRLEQSKTLQANVLSLWNVVICRQLGQEFSLDHLAGDLFADLLCAYRIHPVSFVLSYYPLIWLKPRLLLEEGKIILEKIVSYGQAAGYLWLAALAAEMLAHIYKEEARRVRNRKTKEGFVEKEQKYDMIAAKLHKKCHLVALTTLIQPAPEYEVALNTLINLAQGADGTGAAGSDQRLVWWFFFDEEDQDIILEPRVQKLGKSGKWTKGRVVSLKRLATEPEQYPFLTEQDRRACDTINMEVESYGWGYRQHSYYAFDSDRAALALIGHPLVFLKGTTTPVQLVRGEPALRISKKRGRIAIRLEPVPLEWKNTLVVRESATRYVIYSFTEQQQKMARVVQEGLVVPAKVEPLARKAADALASTLTVQSEIGGGTSAREVASDPAPHVLLVPWNDGLQAEMVERPLGLNGPAMPPGQGTSTVLAEIEGERCRAERDLKQEKKLAGEVIRECPVLAMHDSGDYLWRFDDPETCLELLLQLRQQEQVAVEWPQGERFRVRDETGFDQLSLKMGKGKGDWFQASGKLAVDDALVLDLRQLLDRLAEREGRFIRLDDGSFLALTRAFQKRLEDLRAYSTPSGKAVKLNPLASLALDDFFTEAGALTGDKAWKAHLRRFEPPKPQSVPSTLQAELRPYQVEGFRWLTTLAAWGVGACLADDMGLGKTVQALAALLTMADKGPILVVAPLSVVANWQEECLRFAPSFNVLRFGPGDRQAMLDNLQPFDLVVCSYGLLPIEAERLVQVQWQGVVLDEAQAIKNRTTKRSRAARRLQAEFRLITTGTPVENHLGELWTLFEFLNPGLLGSFKQFSDRFGNIGSEGGDPESRERLRHLIRPFILRRLKSEVLTELPPRTDITMRVGMSEEEKALYEAMRLKALDTLAAGDGKAGHLQILAEIMRLRRLCCNPALVLDDLDAAIPSSKLKVFGDIVRELIDNRHKALVFSQFVGHLALIRAFLDEEGISYQYLDGQTTAAQRKKRIAAFQAGEGDLFLISLKAGGSGLNLTAADYVIHMDPWWNPAVEDQASDRAHRIGQQRPVTVYRLVMEGSIEEQIVELHARKRDLANSLLEGTDVSGRMSAEELLALLRDAG